MASDLPSFLATTPEPVTVVKDKNGMLSAGTCSPVPGGQAGPVTSKEERQVRWIHKTMNWRGVIFILRVTILMFINSLNIKKIFLNMMQNYIL